MGAYFFVGSFQIMLFPAAVLLSISPESRRMGEIHARRWSGTLPASFAAGPEGTQKSIRKQDARRQAAFHAAAICDAGMEGGTCLRSINKGEICLLRRVGAPEAFHYLQAHAR